MALPRDGYKRELVDGEIVVSPAGAPHGQVIMRLGARLGSFVEASGAGVLLDSSTGCWMPSGNLRSPDLTFVARDRLPTPLPEGFLRVVPDLVVEVLSPGDSRRAISEKVAEYLMAGVRAAWVIDRSSRTAVVHRAGEPPRVLAEDEDLLDADVLPGFRCRLGDLLP
jgi:Uma2 family endonuclease